MFANCEITAQIDRPVGYLSRAAGSIEVLHTTLAQHLLPTGIRGIPFFSEVVALDALDRTILLKLSILQLNARTERQLQFA